MLGSTCNKPKRTFTNQECVKKRLTTHYTDRCGIKHPELQAKYVFGQMRLRGSQKNLQRDSTIEETVAKAEPTPERDS